MVTNPIVNVNNKNESTCVYPLSPVPAEVVAEDKNFWGGSNKKNGQIFMQFSLETRKAMQYFYVASILWQVMALLNFFCEDRSWGITSGPLVLLLLCSHLKMKK